MVVWIYWYPSQWFLTSKCSCIFYISRRWFLCPHRPDTVVSKAPAIFGTLLPVFHVSHGVSSKSSRASAEPLTSVGEVKGSEEGVVVFGRHSGVRWVKKNAIGSQQLLHILLQLLFLLDDDGWGFGHVRHLHDSQHWTEITQLGYTEKNATTPQSINGFPLLTDGGHGMVRFSHHPFQQLPQRPHWSARFSYQLCERLRRLKDWKHFIVYGNLLIFCFPGERTAWLILNWRQSCVWNQHR